ncbi:hypothetical protein A2765_02830 [Candidatus Kaiserbacteria bacterium RIFCSPHIGHO2_01_FULL_56_24]|uniref:Uncharacterized protein n=1 Tax=Candidatus Kaiserbacteria bacterium RIFCSPHIGHO2_01_FULL_56_24 TaxID=1798487 RepID=A0A1F6DB23_9BACT|nr:MAG: hypothetical protein A2765_02830 [Candidatus Kaiserbacteria bacterium RIFCSPHIGHO2_01_FULL_56_24]
MYRALQALSDPDLSVEVPLVEGKAPGTWGLIQSLFPPENLHRNQVPARFSVDIMPVLTYEFTMMVNLVCDDLRGTITAVGHLAHDQQKFLRLEDEISLFIAARYRLRQKTGFLTVSKKLWDAVNKYATSPAAFGTARP